MIARTFVETIDGSASNAGCQSTGRSHVHGGIGPRFRS
jgi:hypothetical protein